MMIKKVFVASSTKMKETRIQLENFLLRKSKLWEHKGCSLDVENSDQLSKQMQINGSQDHINREQIEQCDIFILLVEETLGKHTEDEFYLAESLLAAHESLLILTYFNKVGEKSSDDAILRLKNRLKERNHYYAYYEDFDKLWNLINEELEKYEMNGFKKSNRKPNEFLCERLIELHSNQKTIQAKLHEFQVRRINWQSDTINKNKLFNELWQSYGGIIGTELNTLYMIGNPTKITQPENEAGKSYTPSSFELKLNYTKKCIDIAQAILDMVIYAYMSVLWDFRFTNQIEINDDLKIAITSKIVFESETNLLEQFQLLQLLHQIFIDCKIEKLPFPELGRKTEQFLEDSVLHSICVEFTLLTEDYASANHARYSVYTGERLITSLLVLFDFIINYKMISVKRIYYREKRNSKPNYLYRLLNLGPNTQAEIAFINEKPITTDSVLLFKGDNYQEHINLTPFIIDLTSLSYEEMPGICILKGKDGGNNALRYTNTITSKEVLIKKENLHLDTTDSTFFTEKEIKKRMNFNLLHELYEEAVICLTK